jgi:hypothetical protein
MADTGLPNKEDSRFPSVPPRPCLFHQLALSKDRKKRSKLHVSLLIFPQASDSLCHPFFFLLSFRAPLYLRAPFPLMAQSPLPPLDDSHNNTENSSPSDFHSSVETSPAIVPLSETPASDGGHSPSSSSTRPSPYQHRNSLDLQRSSVSAAGRGGCWCVFVLPTCRPFVRSHSLLCTSSGPAVSDEKYVFR